MTLHDGLLSRDGWYLLDDTARPRSVIGGPPGFGAAPRPRRGAYQDGYFFGYGPDYARGLRDLRAPYRARAAARRATRSSLWFSRYFTYKQSDYAPLLARFQDEKVPLDVLMVDTDFKAPHSWNGWELRPSACSPTRAASSPGRKGRASSVSLNVHPSIS